MTTARGLVSPNGTALGRPPQPTHAELDTGLSIWRGTVSEEYLPDLKPWTKAYKVFTEMLDDVVIGTLYESVFTPLLESKFSIEAASQESQDIEAAEWLERQLLQSETFSWHDHVEEMLSFLPYGFSLAEKVLQKSPDGTLILSDLIPIGQNTLLRWGPTNDRGFVKSFLQTVITDAMLPQVREAPMSKLVHFTFRGHKRNPMGRSLNRNLYRPWYFAKNLQVVEAIGAERDVGNVPVFTLGEGVYTTSDMDKLKVAGGGLRIDETSFLILPPGVEAKPFGSGGKVYNIREIIRDYQHLIRQRFFMDFVSLGSEQVGTQALAKEVTSFFALALGAVQRRMLEGWNSQLIPWIFKWNLRTYGALTELPKLKWARPGRINVQSVAQSVATLAGTIPPVIHVNKALEDQIREDFELPPISDAEVQELEQQALEKLTRQVAATTPQQVPGTIRGGDEASKISSAG